MNGQHLQDYRTFRPAPNDDLIARERRQIGRYAKLVDHFFEAAFCVCIAHNEASIRDADICIKQRFGAVIYIQDEPESVDRDGGLTNKIQRVCGA